MEFQYLNGLNSEIQDKQAEAYLYASSGTTGIAATGVIEGLVVRQTLTASGSVLIDAGACLNQASLGQGADRLINPSQKTLDIFTANPVGGLPRNDIVVFDSITTAILAITGTPNAAPTDPTVPATSVALARLRHLSPGGIGATTIPTAQIDNLIVTTTLRGVPAESFGGTPLYGTYDATKPIRHFLARKVGTSDAAGMCAVSTMPSGTTVILSATTGMNLVTGHTILLRTDITLPVTATFQLRNSATPYAALATTAYDFNHDIAYQV
jgi:hypothetical protein